MASVNILDVYFYSLLHCPEQKHNCVHLRLTLKHLHLFVQAFLHPHFKCSLYTLAASGRVVQHGVHWESSLTLSHIHINLVKELGALMILTVPRCVPPDKQPFLHACNVGGMFSILRGRERNVLFNDALNTFYLRLYGVRHMVNDNSDSEKGNPLPPHRLLLSINSKGSFICTIPQTG